MTTYQLQDLDALASRVRTQTTRVAPMLLVLTVASAAIAAIGIYRDSGLRFTIWPTIIVIVSFTGLWIADVVRDEVSGVRSRRAGYGIAAALTPLLFFLNPLLFVVPNATATFMGLLLIIPAVRLRSRLLAVLAVATVLLAPLSWALTTDELTGPVIWDTTPAASSTLGDLLTEQQEVFHYLTLGVAAGYVLAPLLFLIATVVAFRQERMS